MNRIGKKCIFRRLICLCFALLLAVAMTGCGGPITVAVWNRVMTIGDMDVSYDLLRYFVMNSIYDSSDIDPEKLADDPAMQERLEDNVYTMLRTLAAYVSLADSYNITVSSQEKSEIKREIRNMKDEYSKEEFKEYLAENYITEDVLYQLCVLDSLRSGIYTYLAGENSPISFDDDTVKQDIADGNWFYAEYIGLTFESDTEDDKRAEIMQEMHDRAASGESMAKLAEEYRKVFGLGVVGYMNLGGFTLGQEKQYFEDTVRSLEIGAYSEVCEMPEGGYYIAHRLPLEESYITENFEEVFRAGYLDRKIGEIIDNCAAELEVKFRSKYEDFEFWTMK